MTLTTQHKLGILTERNRFIYEYYQAHPRLTYSSIARIYGLSPQRVRYLIHKQLRDEALKDKNIYVEYMLKKQSASYKGQSYTY